MTVKPNPDHGKLGGNPGSTEDGPFARFILFVVQKTIIAIGCLFLLAIVVGLIVASAGPVLSFALSIFTGVKVAFLALANLVIAESWLQQLTLLQTVTHIALGFVAGLLIGFIRYQKRYRETRVVEAFVDSFGDPVAIQAAAVGNACLALHVVVSVGIALGLEGLGVTLFSSWTGGGGTVGTPFALAIAMAGGSGPPGGGLEFSNGSFGFVVLLIAIVLLVLAVAVLASIIVHMAIALASGKVVSMSAVAAGAIQGAQTAVGRTVALAFVTALTRSSLHEANEDRTGSDSGTKPDLLTELQRFRFYGNVVSASSQPLYRALDGFHWWCRTNYPNLTMEEYDACVKKYVSQPLGMDAAGIVGLERRLRKFSYSGSTRPQTPPMGQEPEKLPPLIGGAGSLLYEGWRQTALKSAIRTGVITGSVYVVVISIGAAVLQS